MKIVEISKNLEKIVFEHESGNPHNLSPPLRGKCLNIMGKQHNKLIKRQRRKAYLKRKRTAAKK